MILTHGIYAYSSHSDRIQRLSNTSFNWLNDILLCDYRIRLSFKDTLREYIKKPNIRNNIYKSINSPYYTLQMKSTCYTYRLTTLRRCIN